LPAQRALLEERLSGKPEGRSQGPCVTPIKPISRESELLLTFREERHLQRRVALGAEPLEATRNICSGFRVTGALNEAALEQSIYELARRHEALRTRFPLVNGHPRRVIEPLVSVSLPAIDLLSIPETQRPQQVLKIFAEGGDQPFDLLNDLLWRIILLQVGKDDWVMLMVVDHFISDNWSINVLQRDLWTLYYAFSTNTPSPLIDLPVQFADFAHWERHALQGEGLEQLVSYWNKQLEGMGAIPEIRLPFEQPMPRLTGNTPSKTRSVLWPSDLTASIEETSQRQGVTTQIFLMAGLVLLLYRYTGEGDIGIRFAVAKRHLPETEEVVGWFSDRLVLRAKVVGKETFSALLQHVRDTLIEAYDHQDLPYYMFPGADQELKDLHYPTVSFNMVTSKTRHVETPAQISIRPETLRVTKMQRPDLGQPETSPPGITITVIKSDRLSVIVRYEANRYEAAAITGFLDNYCATLEAALAHPEKQLCEFHLPVEAKVWSGISGSRFSVAEKS